MYSACIDMSMEPCIDMEMASRTASVGDTPFGEHKVSAPAHTQPIRPNGSNAQHAIFDDIMAVVQNIHSAVDATTISFEQLREALQHITLRCQEAKREATLESESHKARLAMLLQEMQEELSARDIFATRIVERMRATDNTSSDQETQRNSSFLRAMSDVHSIQTAIDELSPSFVARPSTVSAPTRKGAKKIKPASRAP